MENRTPFLLHHQCLLLLSGKLRYPFSYWGLGGSECPYNISRKKFSETRMGRQAVFSCVQLHLSVSKSPWALVQLLNRSVEANLASGVSVPCCSQVQSSTRQQQSISPLRVGSTWLWPNGWIWGSREHERPAGQESCATHQEEPRAQEQQEGEFLCSEN